MDQKILIKNVFYIYLLFRVFFTKETLTINVKIITSRIYWDIIRRINNWTEDVLAENDKTGMFEGFRQTRNENLADKEYGDQLTGNIFKPTQACHATFFGKPPTEEKNSGFWNFEQHCVFLWIVLIDSHIWCLMFDRGNLVTPAISQWIHLLDTH